MAKQSDKPKLALVIVESPAKARTIAKYLGPGYIVESSIGHIRDLPSTAAEIPAAIKGEEWSRLGVNVNEDFAPVYIVPAAKKAQVKKLRDQLKRADTLLLATDEDREGEAIAWHLVEVLEPKCPVRRMVFDEITKSAIQRAVENPREIDAALVQAQETRRILDRLYGYEVSPVLWRKVKPRLSAGRVQSVATRLVVDRERARIRFKKAEYWDVEASLTKKEDAGAPIDVRMVELGGKRLALGKDFDETTGLLKDKSNVVVVDASIATNVAEVLKSKPFRVSDITEKPFNNRPNAPFITSSLQQEAGRKLRFTAQRTMRAAQGLYENGYITYMRTDSTTLSTQAIDAARKQVGELYGKEFLPDSPRVYKGKSKNAQEAHEAIRPAGESFRVPKSLEGELGSDQFKLYELIWKRTVASQMKDANGMRTQVRIEADAEKHGTATFTASGKVILFPGFLRAYVEGSDDPGAELQDQESILPPLKKGETLDPKKVTAIQHFTQPPARYTEASLIRDLEELGIGRPSTYATIIQTIQDRGYVWRKGSALVPTFTAFAVITLLERHLGDLVDYGFTARLEDDLDEIAGGRREASPWLHSFYFGETGGKSNGDRISRIGLKKQVDSCGADIDPREVCSFPIGTTAEGKDIVLRVGRYGPFVQLDETRASVPDDIAPDELTVERAVALLTEAEKGDRVLGQDPDANKPVYIKTGRFGPYVQLGDPEVTEKGKLKRGGKPKMASLWPTMSLDTIDLEQALMLLSFPRTVGEHPETKEPITAQDGRYGPYLRMGTDSRSLDSHDKLASVTLDEALEIFKQPKGRRGATAAQSVLLDLGEHPQSGDKIQVKNGRFGPYVTDGVVNATVPKDKDPATVTMPEALDLLLAREAKMREQGKDPRAKAKRKSVAKKAAKKKTGAKKKSASAKKKTPEPKTSTTAA